MTQYLLIDTETGGRFPEKCTPLSLYAEVLDENLEPHRSLDWSLDLKIKPDDGIYRVEAEGLEVNGINLVEHDKTAITCSQAGRELRSFITGARVCLSYSAESKMTLLGHNVSFDARVVTSHLMQDFPMYVSYRTLDTATIVRFLQEQKKLPENIGSLGSLLKHFEIAIGARERHTAKGDARATLQLYKKLRSL